MSAFFRSRTEKRALTMASWGAGGAAPSMSSMGDRRAMSLVPVYSAVSIIARHGASTPLYAYAKNPDGTSTRLAEQPPLLVNPDPFGRDLFTWWLQCWYSLLLMGNAYGLVTEIGPDGFPTKLLWLDPRQVNVQEFQFGTRPEYRYNGALLDPDEVVHIAWMAPTGWWKGLTPIALFAETIGVGLSTQESTKAAYDNAALPGVHVRNTQKTLGTGEATITKRQYKAAVVNRDVWVTGNDWEATALTLPPDQARFIEQTRLTSSQIAAIFDIDPTRIGGESNKGNLHYDSPSLSAAEFRDTTMRPWFAQMQATISRLLRPTVDARFDDDSIVRPSMKERAEGYEIAQRAQVMTNNEVREAEKRSPLTDADRADWQAMWGPKQKNADTGGLPA